MIPVVEMSRREGGEIGDRLSNQKKKRGKSYEKLGTVDYR